MAEGNKKIKATVYLIKDTYSKPNEFILTNKVQSINLNKCNNTLFYKVGIPSTTKWAALFDGVKGFSPTKIKNKNSSAIFVTKVKGRFLCYTFGHSRHYIEPFAYERNFGLKVSLNLAAPKALKSIDKTK